MGGAAKRDLFDETFGAPDDDEQPFDQTDQPGGSDRLRVVPGKPPAIPLEAPTDDGPDLFEKTFGGSQDTPRTDDLPSGQFAPVGSPRGNPAEPADLDRQALELYLQGDHGGAQGVDEHMTPESAAGIAGAGNAYLGGLTGKLDQRLPVVGDSIKGAREQYAAENPKTAFGADLLGALTSPIGMEAKGEGVMANAGAQAVTGAAQSGARSLGDSGDDDYKTQLLHAFLSSGVGGALGGAGAVAAHGLGAAADWAGEKAGDVGNYLRRAAYGVSKSDVDALTAEKGTTAGLDYAENELGRLPDKLGLSNRLVPTSAGGYARKGEAAKTAGGQTMGAGLDRAAGEVPSLEIDRAKDSLLEQYAQLANHDRTVASGSKGTAPYFDDMASRLQDATPATPRDLHSLKTGYESLADAPGAIPGSQESAKAIANNAAGNSAREQLTNVMGQASPESNRMFQEGAQQYGDAATVEDIAKRAASKNIVAPLLGASLGGYAGYQTRHDLEDAGFGALAGGALVRGGQTYGADFGANLARGAETLAGGAGNLAGAAESGAGVLGTFVQQRERLKQAATDGNGGELPDTINRVLQDPQQAPMLGKYRAQFEQAGRTPDGMRALLAKLEQDTQWRTGIKPQLLSMTGDR